MKVFWNIKKIVKITYFTLWLPFLVLTWMNNCRAYVWKYWKPWLADGWPRSPDVSVLVCMYLGGADSWPNPRPDVAVAPGSGVGGNPAPELPPSLDWTYSSGTQIEPRVKILKNYVTPSERSWLFFVLKCKNDVTKTAQLIVVVGP